MGRKKKMKSNSSIIENMEKSQKEPTNKRSSSSLEVQTPMGNSQQNIAYQPVFPKDDFSEGRKPWMMLLFDVKIGRKCKSHPKRNNFSMSSPFSSISTNPVGERQDSCYKLSNLLGEITFEDWSNQSYLILMTLRDDDSSEDGEEQLHNSVVTHTAINEMSFEIKSESRPTMTSVMPLRELCQTALEVSHLKYQVSPASEILEQLGSRDILRQIETCQLSYSVPSLRDLSKVVVDRLQRARTNTNSASQKDVKTTSSSSEISAPTLQHLCETVVRGLQQQRVLSKETERAGTPGLEDTKLLHTVPSLRHLAGKVLKNLRISSRDKGSTVSTLKDPRQSFFVPTLKHLTKIVVKDLQLSSRDKLPCLADTVNSHPFPSLRQLAGMVVKNLRLSSGDRRSNVPSLECTGHYKIVPSLRHLARMMVKSLHLNSRNKVSHVPTLEETKQSYNVPSLCDLAWKVVNARETGSTIPSVENKRHIYTVPNLHGHTEMLVKNLQLNSRDMVSTNSKLGSSSHPTPATNHLFTVPSLRHLCQVVVDELRCKQKEKESRLSKNIESQQQIPSLLEIKVTRPRIQRRPKVPVSGFPPPTRAPMQQMNFNRPMFTMDSRCSLPPVRPPMTRQPFWRMNRPPPNFWPSRGSCGPYGVPPFGPRYGRF